MVKPYLKNNEKVPPGTGHFPVPTLAPWGQVPPQGLPFLVLQGRVKGPTQSTLGQGNWEHDLWVESPKGWDMNYPDLAPLHISKSPG